MTITKEKNIRTILLLVITVTFVTMSWRILVTEKFPVELYIRPANATVVEQSNNAQRMGWLSQMSEWWNGAPQPASLGQRYPRPRMRIMPIT